LSIVPVYLRFFEISVVVVAAAAVVVVLVNGEKVELRHCELLHPEGNNNSHVTCVLGQKKYSTSFIDLQLCVK